MVKSFVKSVKLTHLIVAVGMLSATLVLGYGLEQASFGRIALAYGAFFGLYAWQAGTAGPADVRFWLVVAVVLRVVLLGAFPALSDDVFRFVWDGRLWLAGENSFDHLPSWYLAEGRRLPGLTEGLYARLNSPDYYTIYPPVAQAVFAASCWIAPGDVGHAATVMQAVLLSAEIGTLVLLQKLLRYWALPPQRVLWYALNPLIIVEITGNLHFEGMMIFFLLLGTWWLLRWRETRSNGYFYGSAAAMALAVASKLLPLLFFPFLLRRLGWRRAVGYFAVVGGVLALTWWPLLNASFLANFSSSVDLYFRRFEFNGSLYYLLRGLGYHFRGHNLIRWIGPALAVSVFVVIMGRVLLERITFTWRELPGRWLFAITVYLLCATTVHPWYTALPVVLCLFTPYRWPVVWSGMIVLTYINYSYGEYYENLWIVALEYVVVLGYAGWEYARLRKIF